MQGNFWTDRFDGLAMFVTAAAAHAFILLILLYTPAGRFGVSRAPSESISLAVVQTLVVEAVEPSPSVDIPAAAASSVDALPPSPPAPEPVSKTEVKPAPPETTEPATDDIPHAPVGPKPAMPSLVTAPDEKPDPQVKPAESSETKSAIESDEPKQRETKPRTKPQDARTAASAPAVAPSSGKARAAQVTASQGEMIAYAAAIRARLASKKPTSIRRKGTVTITFGLSAAGSLLFARIADGSGHADLDAAVIASVHRAAPFPEAPDRKDRTFTLPFHFR